MVEDSVLRSEVKFLREDISEIKTMILTVQKDAKETALQTKLEREKDMNGLYSQLDNVYHNHNDRLHAADLRLQAVEMKHAALETRLSRILTVIVSVGTAMLLKIVSELWSRLQGGNQ